MSTNTIISTRGWHSSGGTNSALRPLHFEKTPELITGMWVGLHREKHLRQGSCRKKSSGQPWTAQTDHWGEGLWGEIRAASILNHPKDLERAVLCSGH